MENFQNDMGCFLAVQLIPCSETSLSANKSNLIKLSGSQAPEQDLAIKSGLRGTKLSDSLSHSFCPLPPLVVRYSSAAFCINSNYTHDWGISIWTERISGHYELLLHHSSFAPLLPLPRPSIVLFLGPN